MALFQKMRSWRAETMRARDQAEYDRLAEAYRAKESELRRASREHAGTRGGGPAEVLEERMAILATELEALRHQRQILFARLNNAAVIAGIAAETHSINRPGYSEEAIDRAAVAHEEATQRFAAESAAVADIGRSRRTAPKAARPAPVPLPAAAGPDEERGPLSPALRERLVALGLDE